MATRWLTEYQNQTPKAWHSIDRIYIPGELLLLIYIRVFIMFFIGLQFSIQGGLVNTQYFGGRFTVAVKIGQHL